MAQERLGVALDPDLLLFRRVAPEEAPPILREAMLAGRPTMLALTTDAGVQAAARELVARLFERTGRASATVTLVAGLHADIDRWLSQSQMEPRPAMLNPERGTAQVWTVRASDGGVFVLVSVSHASALAALARPLPHYGSQSWLAFDGARALDRGVWPARPQVWVLKPQAGGGGG